MVKHEYNMRKKNIHITRKINYIVQCVPQKGFGGLGSAVCVQRDRWIVYNIVSQTAGANSPNPFRGIHCILNIEK